MPTLQIPNVYRGHTRREASVEVSGETIGACLDAAEAVFPGFRALVVDDSGATHKFNKVLLDGELLPRGADTLDTPVFVDDDRHRVSLRSHLAKCVEHGHGLWEIDGSSHEIGEIKCGLVLRILEEIFDMHDSDEIVEFPCNHRESGVACLSHGLPYRRRSDRR